MNNQALAQVLPSPGGTEIAPTTPRNQQNITPDNDISVISPFNDTTVVYHYSLKPYEQRIIPTGLDRKLYAGHESQIISGDLLFSYVGGGHKDYDDHRLSGSELGKINEIICVESASMKATLSKLGGLLHIGTSRPEGFVATSHDFEVASLGAGESIKDYSSIRGFYSKEILYFIYENIFKHNPGVYSTRNVPFKSGSEQTQVREYLSKSSFIDIVRDASALCNENFDFIQNQGGSFTSTPEAQVKHLTGLTDMPREYAAWPADEKVYQKHVSMFPNKKRVKDSLGKYYSLEEQTQFERESENKTHMRIEQCKTKLLADPTIWQKYPTKLRTSDRVNLLDLYQYALVEFLAQIDQYVRFCTIHGVYNDFRFLGAVQNTGDGRDPNAKQSKMTSVVNTAQRGRAEVINRFGPILPAGTKTYIMLKRECDFSNPFAPFMFIPWDSSKMFLSYTYQESTGDMEPSPVDLEYYERNGNLKIGHKYFVGTVRFSYTDTITDEVRRVLNGIPKLNVEDFVPYSSCMEMKGFVERNAVKKLEIFVSE